MSYGIMDRRLAILGGIRAGDGPTAAMLRQSLAHHDGIHVTIDTVQRDLRAMEEVGTLRREPHPTAGHEWGGGRWIAHTGWRMVAERRAG